MAVSSQVRNIKEHPKHKRVAHIGRSYRSSSSQKKGILANGSKLKNVGRYQKQCRNWSIISNVAAIVSVTGAFYSLLNKNSSLWNKKRFW